MKKFLALLFAVIMVCSLTACGEKSKNDDFGGTWKVDSIEYEGSKFTVDEWNNMEDEDLSGFYIIFKDGGKAYVYDGEYGDLVDWLKSEDSLMIGDRKCSIIEEKICFEYHDAKIYLNKSSDSQEIPAESKEDDFTDTDDDQSLEEGDDSTTAETTESELQAGASADDTAWKQFLSDYEAWVDNYISLLKKYKDNPSDISVLSEYTEMISEMAEWSERADEISLEIEDEDAASEYAEELLRIAGKLSEAAY